MRVIHGVWAQGALGLWAEDPDLPVSGPPAAGEGGAPHPFACQAAEVADLLTGAAGEAAGKAVEVELTLRLPSVGSRSGSRPLASPELIRPSGAPSASGAPGRGRVVLAGWRVPALAFGPEVALDVLAAPGHPGHPAAAAGASLPYLAAVARFAADLAARGRVLPVLAGSGTAYAARWRPVLGGADAQRARDLAAAMPASCRAAGDSPAGLLLADMLDALTDAAARARLPEPLLPARRGRSPARLPLAERFVLALTTADARVGVLTPPDEAEAAELAGQLDAWLDGARIPAGPVRTCFRLVEPEAVEPAAVEPAVVEPAVVAAEAVAAEAVGGGRWRVEFALQSAE